MDKQKKDVVRLNGSQPAHIEASEERIRILQDKLFKATDEAMEQAEGSFSFFELQDAFLKVSFSYNSRGLKDQHTIKEND